jgi:hypothetical protein
VLDLPELPWLIAHEKVMVAAPCHHHRPANVVQIAADLRAPARPGASGGRGIASGVNAAVARVVVPNCLCCTSITEKMISMEN